LPPLSPLTVTISDAILLVLLISPALYFLLFRPMVSHIRERQKVEAILLKNQQDQFKIMLRASLDGFWLTDMQGRFLEVNYVYCGMMGYSRDELLTMCISDVEAIETPVDTGRRIAKLMEMGSVRFETRHRRKDGILVDMEVGANYTRSQGGQIYCFLRDISERKRAAEESEWRVQILNNVSDTIFLLDLDGNFIYLNEAAWKTRGYTQEEMMGMNLRTLDAPEYVDSIKSRFKELLKKGEGCFKAAHRCKDGSIMQVEINSRVIESGGHKRLLSVIRDITAQTS
jgi:PAS domain S-box-containing protein